jgi:hypothetical protein
VTPDEIDKAKRHLSMCVTMVESGTPIDGETAARLIADGAAMARDLVRWREVTGADSPDALDAEAKAIRARARGAPTRGHLVCAVNDAGHDRVEAQYARDAAAAQHRQSPTAERTQALATAEQRLTAAKEDEHAARANLAAFERERGLTITCREQESS